MKKFLIMAAASGLALAAATPADAAVVIGIGVNGAAPVQVATDLGTGSASFVTTQDGFFFNVGGTGFPLLPRPELLTQSINLQQQGGAAGTMLSIFVTQTDLTSFNNNLFSSFTSNTVTGATATIRSFVSASNALFGGTELQSANFNAPGVFVGANGVNQPGPFSTTVRYDITFTGASGGNFNGTGNLTAVPEPATWAMMIMGFGLVGGVMRRRSMKVAFA